MYKYLKIDNQTLANLSGGRLYCRHYEDFNDPFEPLSADFRWLRAVTGASRCLTAAAAFVFLHEVIRRVVIVVVDEMENWLTGPIQIEKRRNAWLVHERGHAGHLHVALRVRGEPIQKRFADAALCGAVVVDGSRVL